MHQHFPISNSLCWLLSMFASNRNPERLFPLMGTAMVTSAGYTQYYSMCVSAAV